MSIGLVGIKLGMSRVFEEQGASVPVTVIHAAPNLICQIKTADKDGYSALQVAVGNQKPQRLSKSLRGHYAKSKVPTGKNLREFRIESSKESEFSIGDALGVTQFVAGQKVDAVGVSKGKGFAGTIKRWNFAAQDATHGNSISHRHAGSTGQCQWPGKVWKGKKMAGQYGNCRKTVQRLQVALIDEENNLLLIKGALPGANGSEVIVKPACKQTKEEINLFNKLIKERNDAQEAAIEQTDTTATEVTEDAKPQQEAAPEQTDTTATEVTEDAKPQEEAVPEQADAAATEVTEDAKPQEEAKPEQADATETEVKGEEAEAKQEDKPNES